MSVRENWQQVRATCLKWDGHFASHDPLKGGFLRNWVTICRKSLKLDSKLREKRIPLKWQMTCGELETQTEKECSPELSVLPSSSSEYFLKTFCQAKADRPKRIHPRRSHWWSWWRKWREACEQTRWKRIRRNYIHNAVLSEIGVIHLYDVYNLCEMVAENILSSFKVKMLRAICTYLEIRFKTRVTKSELVKKLTEMLLGCSCLST